MKDRVNIRQERVERLLEELRYEITRGMLEGDIDETLGFRFYVPISKNLAEGVVHCEFKTRPIHRHNMDLSDIGPRLRLVK